MVLAVCVSIMLTMNQLLKIIANGIQGFISLQEKNKNFKA